MRKWIIIRLSRENEERTICCLPGIADAKAIGTIEMLGDSKLLRDYNGGGIHAVWLEQPGQSALLR